jgi:hypothetical protein
MYGMMWNVQGIFLVRILVAFPVQLEVKTVIKRREVTRVL